MCCFHCCCATGNVFVIAVILLERHLQSVANYLILSLAAADLLVAVLVMVRCHGSTTTTQLYYSYLSRIKINYCNIAFSR